jgi:predicted transcriptional regulator
MARSKLAKQLTEEWGLSLTETGRHLCVSSPAIAKAIDRLNKLKFN